MGDWRTWVCLGGRGAGKTRAGAEWVRSLVEGDRPFSPGKAKSIALIGETYDQAREIMVFGPSGIMASTPPDRRPKWVSTRRRLEWPNGAVAGVYSAHDPEALRGPQFDAAWVDELAKWKKAEEAWDMLQFALRLGEKPQQCVTTTPQDVEVLKRILKSPSTVVTNAPTEANKANLATSFLEEVRARYTGSVHEAQELDGILVEDNKMALWNPKVLAGCREEKPADLNRIVVAIDPPVTGHSGSDECGILVVGAVTEGRPGDWHAVVLEDASIGAASPLEWAQAAVDAMDRHGGDLLVAEVNQGGDMIESLVRQVDPLIPYRSLRATRGKGVRAEPTAALYAQGRVKHRGVFKALEAQMCKMTGRGFQGKGSPDRVDALVWALTELIIDPGAKWRRTQIRSL